MEGVFEDPGQQQNHSDNYEHWSVQSLPGSALNIFAADNPTIRENIQALAEPQEKFSVEPGTPLALYSLYFPSTPEWRP
jgi:hypothetical protein